MKERLNGYIQGLFADAEKRSPGNLRLAELKEELILNTYEKYDDLIAMGKTPDAAYRTAVDGIGDITELLGDIVGKEADKVEVIPDGGEVEAVLPVPAETAGEISDGDAEGQDEDEDYDEKDGEKRPPRSRWYKLVSGIIWTAVIVYYFLVSFYTHAWNITWIVFIMGIAADNVAEGFFDLRR